MSENNELCIEYFLWETGRAIGRVSVRVPGLRPQHIRSTGNQNLSNRNLRSTESYIVKNLYRQQSGLKSGLSLGAGLD